MVRKAFFLVTGLSAALLATAHQVDAQRGAPRVRVTSQPYSSLGSIEPSISLSEPAYILAVAIDRDGLVSVLSPAGPNDLIRFEAAKSLRLPEFFSGFSTARSGYYDGHSTSRYATYLRSFTDDYSTGSVLVLASTTPFNFTAISDGPFWNDEAIRRLVRYRDPVSAVYALGRATTSKGQSFGHDFLRFGANRYHVASADPCSGFGSAYSSFGYGGSGGLHGYSSMGGFLSIVQESNGARVGYRLMSIGADACGRIRYVVVPVILAPSQPIPAPVDSADIPKPTYKSAVAAALGTYAGEEARRVFELIKSRHGSDTFNGFGGSPILKEKEEGRVGRSGSNDRMEGFERIGSAKATPIERAPVLRDASPARERAMPLSRPILRESMVNGASSGQRESSPPDAGSRVKDNQ